MFGKFMNIPRQHVGIVNSEFSSLEILVNILRLDDFIKFIVSQIGQNISIIQLAAKIKTGIISYRIERFYQRRQGMIFLGMVCYRCHRKTRKTSINRSYCLLRPVGTCIKVGKQQSFRFHLSEIRRYGRVSAQ